MMETHQPGHSKPGNDMDDHTTTEPDTPPPLDPVPSATLLQRIISSNEELIHSQMLTIRQLQQERAKAEERQGQAEAKYQALLNKNSGGDESSREKMDGLVEKVVELEGELSRAKVEIALLQSQMLEQSHQEQQRQRSSTAQHSSIKENTELEERFTLTPATGHSMVTLSKSEKQQLEQWDRLYQQYGRTDKLGKFKEKVGPLLKKFIPNQVRSKVWPILIENRLGITNSLYLKLLERREQGVEEKVKSQIQKDIKRSFYGKTAYERCAGTVGEVTELLELFHLFRPDIGYVQGMTYPAMILIPVVGKVTAFTLFANLVLGNPFFRQLMTLENQIMTQVSRCFEALLKEHFPKTASKLKEMGIETELYLIEWLFTFFSRGLSLQTTLQLWDHLLHMQELALFRMALSVFEQLAPILEETTYQQTINTIREYSQIISEELLMESFVSVKLSGEKLARGLQQAREVVLGARE